MESTKPYQILNFFSPNEKEKKTMVEGMLPRTGKAFDFVCLSNSKKPGRSQRSCPGDFPSPFQAGSN